MLNTLDWLLTLSHLAIVLFNLLGWIFKSTRRAHLVVAAITLFCWFVIGLWFGIGYCPLTDWQWGIKRQLGETNLPPSFITYFAFKLTGIRFSDAIVNVLTLGFFLIAIGFSLYLNLFISRHKKSSRTQ